MIHKGEHLYHSHDRRWQEVLRYLLFVNNQNMYDQINKQWAIRVILGTLV